MSDHNAPDESGINRAWLSGALILAALALAGIPSWSKAAPHSRKAPPPARAGVIVLEDGTVKDGTVLVRGSSITLIQERTELTLPRDEVLVYDVDFDRTKRPKGVVVLNDEVGSVHEGHVLRRGSTVWLLRGNTAKPLQDSLLRWTQETDSTLSAEYWREHPTQGRGRVETTDPRTPKLDPRIGCLVQNSGAVLVGRMEVGKAKIRVISQEGVTTEVPASAIRWRALGVTEPTPEYWAAFPQEPLDPRYESSRPARLSVQTTVPQTSTQRWAAAARNDPKIAAALRATTERRWLDSADLWLELYALRGKTTYFQNYSADARKAVEEAWRAIRSEVLLARLDRLFADAKKRQQLRREEVQEVLAGCIRRATREVWTRGFKKTAHALVDRLASLSPAYEREAGPFWAELRKVPPRFTHEPH